VQVLKNACIHAEAFWKAAITGGLFFANSCGSRALRLSDTPSAAL
jgi:hypothetical protein